ncbi:hypothetical protein GL267_002965 [Acidithiobacillus ferrianus]|uniref:Uncharacterized protein n=2 Tax=Acidithiobacillus ferrianus TaxID=2678518 RepID=A0A845UC77_9PROT|nr:hypothetical protein [Acidithiobacillus ferrianus]NDU43367.1 hypothetical protein [Acidithiobacillus ferrianus]
MAAEAMEISRAVGGIATAYGEQPRLLLSGANIRRAAFSESEALMERSIGEETPWVRGAVKRLNELAELPSGWDSYKARVVSHAALKATFDLLSEVMRDDTPLPWIVPMADGHVQVEWHTHEIDFEIEVVSSTVLHVFHEDHRTGFTAWEDTLHYDLTQLAEFIGELTRRIRRETPKPARMPY